jgi:hypothetical protein
MPKSKSGRCRLAPTIKSTTLKGLAAALFLFATTGSFAQELLLTLSSGGAQTGGSVSLSLNLALNGGIQPASVQWLLNYPAEDFDSVQLLASPATTIAGKSIQCTSSPGTTSCLLIGLNVNPISSALLAIATFQISPSTTHQISAIELTNITAASSQAEKISSDGIGGSITILQPQTPINSPRRSAKVKVQGTDPRVSPSRFRVP